MPPRPAGAGAPPEPAAAKNILLTRGLIVSIGAMASASLAVGGTAMTMPVSPAGLALPNMRPMLKAQATVLLS